jgi:transcriptional regulator with XRE-family HTH domain
MSSARAISTRGHNIGTLYFVALLREDLGRRIKTARHDAGLTQRELADRIHLKNATDVSRYERGAVEVPSHRIDLIAQATGRPRSFFTRDPSEEEPDPDPALESLQGEVEGMAKQLERIESLLRQLVEPRSGEESASEAARQLEDLRRTPDRP